MNIKCLGSPHHPLAWQSILCSSHQEDFHTGTAHTCIDDNGFQLEQEVPVNFI